jgi:hypothetical protein
MKLVSKFKTNIYWMEEDGYLILAAIPQLLIERQQCLKRVPIQQWLKQKQRQDVQSSLLAISTTTEITPRGLYYGYLNLLNFVADLADADIDMFALPTVAALNLPNTKGTYGLQLDFAESGLALELTFENNPLEFIGAGGVAVAGILAAVAIPGFMDSSAVADDVTAIIEEPTDHTWPKSESELIDDAWGLLSNIQIPAEEYSNLFGHFPEPAELEEIWGISSGEDINLHLLDSQDGYSADFNDPAISGKLMIHYDANSQSWTCSHEGLSEDYLPKDCL